MSWDDRILTDRELAPYFNGLHPSRLVDRVEAMLEHQKRTWPLLAEGYEGFAGVTTKRIQFDDSYVVVQHNPRRIRSTAASVDKLSVEARGCFLCAESLPKEEKGLEFGNLVILCNPFPVLDCHLSIVHRNHVEQRVAGNLEMLFTLAAELSPNYFVLYNGPQCGASAPDHLHFQACSRALLPIEESARAGDSETAVHCSV